MAFSPLGNYDLVVVSVSIDFPSNTQWDAPCHHTSYDIILLLIGTVFMNMKDVPWEDIFQLCASAAASEFFEWVQVGIDVYIPHRKYQVKPQLIPHRKYHGFQVLVLLP